MTTQHDSSASCSPSKVTHADRGRRSNLSRPTNTRSLIHRSSAARQPSTRSLPASSRRPSLPVAPMATPNHPNLSPNLFNPLDPNSLLLLPLAARLDPFEPRVAAPQSPGFVFPTSGGANGTTIGTINRSNHANSSRPFSRSVAGSCTRPSVSSQAPLPLFARTQSTCACCADRTGSCATGCADSSAPFTSIGCHCINSSNSNSHQHRASCSAGHVPPGSPLQPALQSATSASCLHTALLALLLTVSLVGFAVSKLKDPCDDPLYVSEASFDSSSSGGCSLLASLTFSSCLLAGALFALYVYFVHAIGQCDYNGFGARKRVLLEVLLTLTLSIVLVAATVLLLTRTAATNTSAGWFSAACAFTSALLLVARAFLLRRELRMLDIAPTPEATTNVQTSSEPIELDDDVFRS
jgi:uncharacterized membrane protein